MARAAPAGFTELVAEHQPIVYKICNSYCRNRSDREDLAQEIMVALWRSFGSYDPAQKFSTWMYRVALNVAISFYRRNERRERHLAASEAAEELAAPQPEHEREEVLLLYAFIRKLDPLNRALMLLYLDGNSYTEIADVLGITATNVSTKLNRLKAHMKEAFSHE